MGRIQCKGCKEFPKFTAVRFDADCNEIRGQKCNLCVCREATPS
jgi:hypothetical protein